MHLKHIYTSEDLLNNKYRMDPLGAQNAPKTWK